jgi:hypothetical protein
MEGVLAIIFIFGGGTLFLLSVSPVGKALAERIRAGTHPPAQDPAVYEELDRVRQELAELQERMDFAERLLARKGEVERLPGGE